MRVDSLGYRTDLMLRRLEGSTVEDRGDYLVVASPAHPEFWWGNFLLMPDSALRDDAAVWTARFVAAFPAARHLALGVDGTKGVVREPSSFADAGLKLERSTVLTAAAVREPPHASHAARCRPLESDDDWRQAVALRTACSGVDATAGGREFDEQRVAEARQLAEAGHGACFGAFHEDRLVAQLGVFSDGSGTARYQNVETHPTARRQGLAGTLVHQAGRYAFDVLGARLLVIVADPGYSAIRVYRSVGFTDLETQLALQREPAGA